MFQIDRQSVFAARPLSHPQSVKTSQPLPLAPHGAALRVTGIRFIAIRLREVSALLPNAKKKAAAQRPTIHLSRCTRGDPLTILLGHSDPKTKVHFDNFSKKFYPNMKKAPSEMARLRKEVIYVGYGVTPK